MGLDMYLTKKTYVKNYDYMKPEELYKVTVRRGGKICRGIKPERVSFILEEVAYWRKANAIHKWFVDNCDDGTDEYYVNTDNMENLLNICGKIKMTHELAAELLPTQSGSFIGSIEYDESYFKDIDYTIKVLEESLLEAEKGGDFYYSASW